MFGAGRNGELEVRWWNPMGLKLRYQMFRDTTAEAVYDAFCSFYAARGRPLRPMGGDWERIDIHREADGWVVVNLDGGWEWKVRREAQLAVSRQLCCTGFLVFVFDGDYWGYEFFDRGEALDQFVQESSSAAEWFPDRDCRGDAALVASRLSYLKPQEFAPYLMQMQDWVEPEGMDVPARPGDQFRRSDECAALDFLRLLGVAVERRDGYVRLMAPVFRSAFNVKDPL